MNAVVDDPAWLAFRRAGITASDVAAAWSGRYGGAYEVVARKLGLLPPVERTDRMARGHAWEDRIAALVEAADGVYVVGEQTWCEHPDYPHHRATVDGFTATVPEATVDDLTGLLENKTRGIEVRPAFDYWEAQTQWQMWVTGRPRVILAEAIIDDSTDTLAGLRLHRWDADPYLQAQLVDLAEMLWGHVQAGTLPEPTGAALDAVKAVNAVADPSAAPVPLDDIADLLPRHAELKDAEKRIDEELADIAVAIRHRLGEATKGTTESGWTASVSKPARILDEDAVMKGKPMIDATLQRALAKRAGYELVADVNADACTIEVWQSGRKLGSATYTMEQARTAGLAGKDNWRKNPEDMLFARASTRAIRRFAPDVMTGVISEDEAEDLDPTTVLPTPAPEIEPAALAAGAESVAGAPAPGGHPGPDATAAEPVTSDADAAPATTPPDEQPGAWYADTAALKVDLKAYGIGQAQAIKAGIAAAEGLPVTITTLDSIVSCDHADFRDRFMQELVGS